MLRVFVNNLFLWLLLALAGCAAGKEKPLVSMNTNNEHRSQDATVKLLTKPVSLGDKHQVQNVVVPVFTLKMAGDDYAFVRILNFEKSKPSFLPANCDFYVHLDDKVLAIRLGLGGSLIIKESYFQAQAKDINEATAKFRELLQGFTSDDILRRELESTRWIKLNQAAPKHFFNAGSTDSSQPGRATIKHFELIGDTLRLEIVSEGDKFNGNFWIDLRSSKVVRSIVDGKEMPVES